MDMNYEVKTDKSFEIAVEDLKNSLSSHKFGVLWEMNFKDKLKEKGLEFERNFEILEVCNPQQAKRVLETFIGVGYFLPCKMVVYEDDSTVKIGMIKPTKLVDMIDNGAVSKIALEVEEALKAAIDDAR